MAKHGEAELDSSKGAIARALVGSAKAAVTAERDGDQVALKKAQERCNELAAALVEATKALAAGQARVAELEMAASLAEDTGAAETGVGRVGVAAASVSEGVPPPAQHSGATTALAAAPTQWNELPAGWATVTVRRLTDRLNKRARPVAVAWAQSCSSSLGLSPAQWPCARLCFQKTFERVENHPHEPGGTHNRFDDQGILNHIATRGGTHPWKNPARAGHVRVQWSSVLSGDEANLVAGPTERVGASCTKNVKRSWMMLDLGPERRVALDYYVLRHPENRFCQLRHWELQASTTDSVDGPW